MSPEKGVILASAPGRVSLFGEYSKLVGESITISLDDIRTYCNVEISQNKYHTLRSTKFKNCVALRSIGPLNGNWSDYVNGAIHVFQEKLNTIVPFLDIEINSNIPISSGLASSSSLIVSVINGISQTLGVKISKIDIANMAFAVESSILNIPCGQMDQYACSLGGVVYLDNLHVPPKSIEQYSLSKDTIVVIADSGIKKNTKQISDKVINSYKKGEENIERHIKLERELIKKARSVLVNDKISLSELGKLINIAHQSYKNNLHASNTVLNNLCETALKCGAYGAKISGGGFGGCVFALTDTEKSFNIKRALERKCNSVFISKISI